MNVTTIQGAQSWGLLVLVIVTACFGKIVGTIVVSLLCKLPVQEAVTIGFLMNTKGLVELIVPTLAKIEDSRNIPGMLNLTNVSQGIEKREGLRVYVMHLMELSERSLAILMVHKAKKNRLPFWNTEQMQDSNQIIVAFETFSNLIGILVDRGLGGASQVSSSNVDFSVTALFFGGHDDREALAYGVRIAEHPGISLVVVRFIVDPEVNGTSVKVEMNNSFIPEAQSDDEEFLANVKQKSYIDGSIKYEERIVKNARGTIEAIREYNLCNLFLVGRMPKGQVVVALDKKSDCPELGSLGNLLTLPECSTTTSVLVVQQYRSQLPQESPSSLKEESSDADCDSE
ncbi:Cation/H(+) antiporter 18 [Capsicum annuum]|nr:Cation/H(+) antiporter 18 [Capsicum annuum]KAF3646791.1 Cation/H(+) antiporter 18 [Capsicum annuum]